MGGCMGVWSFMIYWDTPTYGWVVGWSVGHVKSLKSNLDLIKIIQLFLMIYDLWVVGWVNGLSQITSNWINLDLIEIIQFCLQIYDLWRYLHAHTTQWSQSLTIEIMSIIHRPTVWLFDNFLLGGLSFSFAMWRVTIPWEKYPEMNWRAADEVEAWQTFKRMMKVIFVAENVPEERQYALILVVGVMRHLTTGIHLRPK